MKRQYASRSSKTAAVAAVSAAALALSQLPSSAAPGAVSSERDSGSTSPSQIAPDPQPPTGYEPQTPQSPYDLMGLRALLVGQYPETFAGLYGTIDTGYTVLEVAPNGRLETCASTCLPAPPSGPGSPAKPNVTFRPAKNSLRSLLDVTDRITQDRGNLEAQGIRVLVWGIDDQANRVVIGVNGLTPDSAAQLSNRYGADRITVREQAVVHTTATRFADSAPWNGGDRIDSDPQHNVNCTSGFGAHSSSAHYMVTAGHCGPWKWYNNGQYIGQTSNDTDPAYSAYDVDAQVIPTSSSNIIWTGPLFSSVRTYITGWANASNPEVVCSEGSFAGERCGNVYINNTHVTFSDGYTRSNIFIFIAPCIEGDSGSPVWRNTGYGPLLAGTVTGTDGSNCYGTTVNADLFAMGVTPNTVANP